MADPVIAVLGASGKVGRRLRARWPADAVPACWPPARWQPGQDLPSAPVLLVLSGVTGGDAAALAANPRIAAAVARAAPAAGVRHVFLASTMAIYGRTAATGAAEDCPPVTPGAYGRSKAAAEATLAAGLAGTGTGLTALRLGNVVGADMLGTVVAGGGRVQLDRFADGSGPLRSYVGGRLLVRVVDALARRVLAGQALPAVLNVAAQAPVAMADLLSAAGIPFDWQPAPATAVQTVVMDCRRLAALVPPEPALESLPALAADWPEGSA